MKLKIIASNCRVCGLACPRRERRGSVRPYLGIWQMLIGEPALPEYGSQVSCPATEQSMGQVAHDSLGSQTLFPHDALNWTHWSGLIPEGHGYTAAYGEWGTGVYPAGMYPRYDDQVP